MPGTPRSASFILVSLREQNDKNNKKKKIKKYKTAKYPIFYTDGFNDEVIETKKKLAGRQAAGAQRDRRRQINKATEKRDESVLIYVIWG